jgi:SAM-dependent methyltransferase
MDDLDRRIREHWAGRDNVRALIEGLAGGDPRLERPAVEDLAPRDQLHAGTLAATERFAAWAGIRAGERVLDLGSGLGGSARFLAARREVRVTALEPCAELHGAGVELTRRSGLSHLVEHVLGDAASFEAPADRFDVVWIQHVEMQVRDKAAFCRAAARCLAPGGRVVWHDWLAGPGGEPRWPVFWSADGSLSFCARKAGFEEHLRGAGLRLSRFEPIPDETVGWFEEGRLAVCAALTSLRAKSPPPTDRICKIEHLVLELENAISNVREGRLIPFFGEAVRSDSRRLVAPTRPR